MSRLDNYGLDGALEFESVIHRSTAAATIHTTATMTHNNSTITNRFSDASIERRDFIRLSALTGGLLALPENATAAVKNPEFDDEYQYVVNHTPEDYAVPTLITFQNPTGLESLQTLGVVASDGHLAPQHSAAYAELTTAEVQQVAELPTAESFTYSPGANPFWRLNYYPLGVFPEPLRSTDHIIYEEMVAGMEHLQSEYPDRLRLFSAGDSPGLYNQLTDRVDPKSVYFFELTNNVQDREKFREKKIVLFSINIHGQEQQGMSAMTRYVEKLLRGNEKRVEELFDEIAIVGFYTNPDGWVARRPQYVPTPGQELTDADPGFVTVADRAPGFYKRGNGAVADTNRQYPHAGWMNPAHYPAEPNGQNLIDDDSGIDSDVPPDILERVPDALAIVNHCRTYENVVSCGDLHGMAYHSRWVLGLLSQSQYDAGELHSIHEMNRRINDEVATVFSEWDTIGDLQEALSGETNPDPVNGRGFLPERSYDWGTPWDALRYTITGGLLDWAGHPRTTGGLGTLSQAYEMALPETGGSSHLLEHLQVLVYQGIIREQIRHAALDIETVIDSHGRDTGYVERDAVARHSDDLSFLQKPSQETNSETRTKSVTISQGGKTSEAVTAPSGLNDLSISLAQEGHEPVRVALLGPDGSIEYAFDPTNAAGIHGLPTWSVSKPTAGDWELRFRNLGTDVETLSVTTSTVQSNGDQPHPRDVWGYDQRTYMDVTPFQFFEDYDEYVDGSIKRISVDKVRQESIEKIYDNLVIIHDHFPDDDYIDAIDSFVEAGGTLVLTDSGVRLLSLLKNPLAGAISEDDVHDVEIFVPHIAERNEDHPLISGTRPHQTQTTNVVGNGIATGDAKMTLVDTDAFESAGTIAGTTDGRVSVGTLSSGKVTGEIHILGGLLRPASQENPHPFGLLDYSMTFLGQTILSNMLGYTQRRYVNGELVREIPTE
jgi:hypothetical protein